MRRPGADRVGRPGAGLRARRRPGRLARRPRARPPFPRLGRHELSLAPGAGQYVRARVSAALEAGVASELEALRATGAVAAFEVLVERAGAVAVAPTPGVSRAAALRARVDATEVREPGSREAVHEWLARELRIT